MSGREEIITFYDPSVPEGRSPWVPGAGPQPDVEVVEPDPAWVEWFEELATRIRSALGLRALNIEHVGSTAVPGLPAKPVIDIDLTVADPDEESAYVPALESGDFELRVREPWWFGHRMLVAAAPKCNLHVFGYGSPELVKHRLFRDWLRGDRADRELYAAAKRQAAAAATSAGEHAMQYNARKEQVVRQVYQRAFVAAGLLDAASPPLSQD